MWIWIAPIILSYAVFVFIAEHINPFRNFREVTARRRIQSGHRAGLIALPVFFVAVFGAQFLLKYFKVGNKDNDFIPTLISETVEEPNKDEALASANDAATEASEISETTETVSWANRMLL